MATTHVTADQVAKARLALEAAEAEHAAALDQGEANKTPEQLVGDLLELIVMRFGNRPDMRALVNRLARLVARSAPAPAPETASEADTH